VIHVMRPGKYTPGCQHAPHSRGWDRGGGGNHRPIFQAAFLSVRATLSKLTTLPDDISAIRAVKEVAGCVSMKSWDARYVAK
jgi:hypothetical protein